MDADEQPESSAALETFTGLGALGVATYLLSEPDVWTARSQWAPWLMVGGALVGGWLLLKGGLRLWGERVSRLTPSEALEFGDQKLTDGCVGVFKWGLIAAAVYGGYRFLTGPFEALDTGTKLIAVLLGFIAVLLFFVLQMLEQLLKQGRK